MKIDIAKLRTFLQHYWLPILAFGVLCIACRDSNPTDGRQIAKLFSGSYYKIYIVVSIVTLLGLAIHRRKMKTIFWALELIFSCLIITNVLKYSMLPGKLLGRPPRMNDGVIVPGGYSPGFPSAHTAFAFGLAWLIFVLKPRYSPLWFAMAVAVGWSRVEIRAHYPYQVICGAILGMLLAHFISGSAQGLTQNALATMKNSRKNRQSSALDAPTN